MRQHGGMADFITHFVRELNGAWLCVSFAEITTILGRIEVTEGTRLMPGTIVLGVDVVKCLDEELEKAVASRSRSCFEPRSTRKVDLT